MKTCEKCGKHLTGRPRPNPTRDRLTATQIVATTGHPVRPVGMPFKVTERGHNYAAVLCPDLKLRLCHAEILRPIPTDRAVVPVAA